MRRRIRDTDTDLLIDPSCCTEEECSIYVGEKGGPVAASTNNLLSYSYVSEGVCA